MPDTETPDVCKVVKDVAKQFEPFEILCRGAGAFPTARDPKTLWIGITDGGDELKRLYEALEEALKTKLRFAKEQRGFHPHLTIGRVKRAAPDSRRALAGLLERLADFDADLAVIDELFTFASFLDRKGPTHEALDHAELGGR